ncbi:MAG TPA: 2-oxoglutarate and iron-dependent oxygenase domain-containing protein [Candidatus Limnocylindria bacterium]|nr:2-oxoglutarate and iron-dependent oxygenase domain-containing protein [Candidatus Limnocylindria bacterium]
MASLLAKDVGRAALPVISIAGLRSPDPNDRAVVAREIRAACVDKGFFYVCDHGVPKDLIAKVFEEVRRFFSLPVERKMTVDIAKSSAFRGYEPMRVQTLEVDTPSDIKEAFTFDRDLPLDHPSVVARRFGYGQNQWPEDLPGWRETLETYRLVMDELATLMVRGMSLSLHLSEDALDGFSGADASGTVRLIHYPPQPKNALPDEKGCGAHTDWGAFTFLLQDDAGGLQVWDQHEGWVHAAPIPGTFVVNVGDMMARWTNDLYKSTMHRVVNVSGRDRISVPFFYNGRLDYRVSCISSCLSERETPKYPATTPSEHLEEMVRRTFLR